jgi:hypothetical protein
MLQSGSYKKERKKERKEERKKAKTIHPVSISILLLVHRISRRLLVQCSLYKWCKLAE